MRAIPRGRVVSYGQLAYRLGAPRAARQVGWAMRRCPDDLPWQRVVMSDGSIAGGGYSELRRAKLIADDLPWQRVVMSDGSIAGGGYSELRRAKLIAEGVPFTDDGRVDMRACRWNGRDAARADSCD